MKSNLVRVGHSVGYLKHRIPDNTFTACVTDPPYELGFMGKSWDSSGVAFNPATWAEVLRTVKPGGILLAFGGSRTYHRIACAIEDSGWILRDVMHWMYGSGFPKSHNIANSIDKKLGCDNRGHAISSGNKFHPSTGLARPNGEQLEKYEARTEQGEPWSGYGTALKPAYEPIIVAMKPLEGTFAENALKWGVAGLNIDGGRIGDEVIEYPNGCGGGKNDLNRMMGGNIENDKDFRNDPWKSQGRWPSNIILDPYTVGLLDGQSGEQVSRFFYCAKASKEEREAGLENFTPRIVNDGRQTSIDNAYQRGDTLRKNTHPTVKPIELMRYLIRLVKMPTDNHILDLFCGSGTTPSAAALEEIEEFTALDMVQEHVDISKARIAHWQSVANKGIDYQKIEEEKQQELF